MKREGNDFSWKVTPIFHSMMKKQKSRRKQRKETEVPLPSSEIPNKEGVLDLEEAKTTQAKEIASLKKRVKKLEQKRKSRTSRLKRLRKVRTTSRIESSIEASLDDQEDLVRMWSRMLKLMKRKLVLLIQSILYGDEVIVDVTAGENVEQNAKVAEQKVSTADPVTTAGEVVTTAGIEVTTATITPQISKDELTVVGNKMHKAFPLLVRKFPLPEEECHCQKKSVATVRSLHCYHCQRETVSQR
nr:hypothetical protein [Tanacetum cinerariifolium]